MRDNTGTLMVGIILGAILVIVLWPKRGLALMAANTGSASREGSSARVCGVSPDRSGWYRPHRTTQQPGQPPTEF